MSRVFVDTSALLGLLVATDAVHDAAKRTFTKLSARQAPLLTTSYVLVETHALLGRRVGTDAIKLFRQHFSPLLDVIWVGKDLHERALDLLLQRSRRGLSLVDTVSFLVIRELKVEEVFAYDPDFEKEGFRVVA